MAKTQKPDKCRYEVTPTLISESKSGLFNSLMDGTISNISVVPTDFIEFELKEFAHFWKYFSNVNNTTVVLNRMVASYYVDVTTKVIHPIPSDTTINTWQKLGISLMPGKYKMLFINGSESEFYFESVNIYTVCVNESNKQLKIFNSDNKWENIGTKDTDLNDTLFKSKGNHYYDLVKTYANVFYPFTEFKTLETGEKLWISSEVNKSDGITALDIEELPDGKPIIQATVPNFIPIDELNKEEDDLYYFTNIADNVYPFVKDVSFSGNKIHNGTIDFSIDVLYNYNENIKYRIKLNDGEFGNWSSVQKSTLLLKGSIASSQLKVGVNTITYEISNEDESKKSLFGIKDAITLDNIVPKIAIITADSNNVKVHFTIVDEDLGDKVKYKITLKNSNLPNPIELVPMTSLMSAPIDITYNIDTTNIIVDGVNVIHIEYEDNYGGKSATDYTFTGEYKNLLFCDDTNEYLTTDKGSILKVLNLGNLVAGKTSQPKLVKLKNNSGRLIDNIRLNVEKLSGHKDINIELSKSNNPFMANNELFYGTEKLDDKQIIEFYVRAKSGKESSGTVTFNVNTNAESLENKENKFYLF